MASPTSDKLRDGLFRVLWKTNSVYQTRNGYAAQASHVLNQTSEVNLINLGVDECYTVHCSAPNAHGAHKPTLTLTLNAFDEKTNYEQRKVTARFLGYEREMLLNSNEKDSKKIKISPSWTAQWTEITSVRCPGCHGSLGMAETFEILIDMGPPKSLKQGQESVLCHLSNLWKTKTLADVTFKLGNRDIKAHTQIVSSGSPILAAMFQNDFEEKKDRIVPIKETKADVFEKLLYFVYTGDVDFKFHDIAALLVAADTYDVTSLKKECDLYLSNNVTLSKATEYLILSYLHDAKELYQATLNYMQKNSETICSRPDWMKLFTKYPKLGFVAMQFMVKKNADET